MSAMKIIRRNKFTILCLIICTGLSILGFIVFRWLFPNFGLPIYGNRLDGIKEVPITSEKLKDVSDKLLKDNSSISKITGDLSGKIINYIVIVVENTKVGDAKKIADQIYANFSEGEVNFYDFQIFIKNEKDDVSGYPLIGYRKVKETSFSFNKE